MSSYIISILSLGVWDQGLVIVLLTLALVCFTVYNLIQILEWNNKTGLDLLLHMGEELEREIHKIFTTICKSLSVWLV